MTPGAKLTPAVLVAAVDRVRRRLQYDVAARMAYGELVPLDDAGRLAFAAEIVGELDAMECDAAPRVLEGGEPTEAADRPRRTTRARFG